MTLLRWLENGFLVACLAIALPVAGLAQAQAPVAPADQASREIRPARVTAPPRIDGRLDDEAWAAGALDIGEWTEGSPNYGRPAPYPTRAWVAYDAERLYLAFQCHDPDPVSLRRGVRRRDSGFGDDRVVVQLDPRNSRQRAIRLSSNADGSQMDVAVTRWNDDDAPDWVWESAGRVTANGYVVEMAVPFASIGVPGGASVRVPVLFWRLFTRRGVWATWPDVPDGQSTFDRSATLVLEDVPPQHVRELIPAATYSASQQRQAAGGFPPVSTDGSLGLTGKYGPRPDVILEATLNPDFSQVESDAYQVEVNQRYPIFYSEKRPFFMTGAELYRLARVGFPQNLSWGVHTRRIMDPAWGAKITGSTGPATFAALFAGDSAPGKSTAAGEPGAGTRELFGAGRVQVGLGSSRNVGVIVSTTSFGARRNVALGADLSYRLAAGHLSALVIGTRTETEGQPTLPSAAAGVGYYLRTRRVSIDAAAEHYGHSFAMDTAFVSQIGFTRVSSMNSLYFYPPSIPGVRAASFWLWTAGVRDRVAARDGHELNAGVRLSMSPQGSILLKLLSGREPWAGRTYDARGIQVEASSQILPSLSLFSSFLARRAPYYEGQPAFAGNLRDLSVGVVFEPTPRLSHAFDLRRVKFNRQDTNEHVYGVVLVDARTTYQFTSQLAARGIVQYDSSRHRVLLDTLGSYEVRPGTLIYAGYGALAERLMDGNGHSVPGVAHYLTTKRGLFVKASYLCRF